MKHKTIVTEDKYGNRFLSIVMKDLTYTLNLDRPYTSAIVFRRLIVREKGQYTTFKPFKCKGLSRDTIRIGKNYLIWLYDFICDCKSSLDDPEFVQTIGRFFYTPDITDINYPCSFLEYEQYKLARMEGRTSILRVEDYFKEITDKKYAMD